MEPGTDRPQFPRPVEIALNDGTFAYKTNCGLVAVNDILYGFKGPDGEYADYETIDKGSVLYSGALTITISDTINGKVISVA